MNAQTKKKLASLFAQASKDAIAEEVKQKAKPKETEKSTRKIQKLSKKRGGPVDVGQKLAVVRQRVDALLAENKAGFLSVSTDQKGGTVVTAIQNPGAEIGTLRELMQGTMQNAAVRLNLCQKVSATSVAGVDYTTVLNLTPGSAIGYSSLNALFDVAQCKGITVKTTFTTSATPTVQTAIGGVAFDPGNNGAFSSVAAVCESKHHLGPVKISNLYGSQSPNVQTSTGFLEWSGKTAPNIESGLVADLVGSNKYPTSASSAIIGYLKPYYENVGVPTITYVHFITFHMEFTYQS